MRIVHSLRVATVVAAFAAIGGIAGAQVSLTNGSPVYTQNFDTLPTANTAWTDNVTLLGWYHQRQVGAVTNIIADSGTSTTGSIYSYGTGTASDRAIGTLASGAPVALAVGTRFKNNGTTAITALRLQYTGEQWRVGSNNVNINTFFYKVSAAPFTGITALEVTDPVANGGYTAFPSLNYTSPVLSATASALDGNLPANQVAIDQTITVTVNPGEEIMFLYKDVDNTGGDHGMGMDNWTVTATFASASDTWTASTGGVTFDDAGHTPVDFTNAPFTKTVTVNATGTTVISTVTGLSGNFSFSGAVPPLGTTLNAGDSQVLTFAYNPTVNDGSTMAQQTATINATTGQPASNTVTLDGGVVRDSTIAAWRTYVEAGNPVAGIKWKITDGIVGSNTLRPSPSQNVITVQDRTDGSAATRGFYVFDNTAQGGALPAVGAAVAVYGTAVKFQGLWEIVPDRPHVAGPIMPTITPVTVAANAIGDNHESVVIRVNSASVAAGTTVTANTTTTFTTANGNLVVQVFTDNTTVNQAITAGVGYDIIGVGFQSDSANNLNSGGVGYRLLPRATADFITPATAVESWSMY